MTPDQIRKVLLGTKGRIFHITFIKRGDGTLRRMTARIGVPPPIPSKHPDANRRSRDARNNLLTVFELPGNQYKCIPLDGILEIRAQHQVIQTGPPLPSMKQLQDEQWAYIDKRRKDVEKRATN